MKTVMKDLKLLIRSKDFYKIIVIDFLFLFLYGFIRSGIFRKIGEYLIALQNDATVNSNTYKALTGFSPLVAQYSQKVMLLIILFFVLIFMLYVIFESLTWWLCAKFKKNITYKNFFFKFLKRSILPYVFFIMYSIISYIQGFLSSQGHNYSSIPMFVFVILVYLSFVYYASDEKLFKSINQAFTQKYFTSLLIFVGLIIINAITSYTEITAVIVIVGIVVVLPGYALLRVNLFDSAK